MAGGRTNNPETGQVDTGGGVVGRAFENLGRGTTLGGLLGNNRPAVRQQENVATPAQQEAAAEKLGQTRRDQEVAQNPGAVQPQQRTTAPTETRSLETFDFSGGGGGGAAGRPVYDRGQVTWKEGAEEFRKRQARSLEYAAIENVRAAEATEEYYENVAIARRDAAAVFKGEADSMGELKERALTESLEQAQRVQAVARKVGAFSPRPGRLFADASGAASFGAALSLAAGAMESARSGGPNVALGIINNAIKRDVAAQELELEGMKAELQAEATVAGANGSVHGSRQEGSANGGGASDAGAEQQHAHRDERARVPDHHQPQEGPGDGRHEEAQHRRDVERPRLELR